MSKMNSFIKIILLIFVLLLMLSIDSFAQVRFIDNKGTINSINGTPSSPNNTITFTGSPAKSLFNNVGFDIRPSTSNNQVLITNGSGIVNWVNFSTLSHTGTTGSVFFANSTTGAPTENNNQFFWDNINNRVGIGTATPNKKLEVNGHIRMTDGNQTANSIMVGDANGTASWSTTSSAIGSIGNHTDVDVSTTPPTNSQILSWDGTNWVPTNETVTTIANTLSGHKIADYTDENGTSIDINETVTSVSQASGNTGSDVTSGDANTIATYSDEEGNTSNINETVTKLTQDGSDNLKYTFKNESGTEVIFRESPIVAFGKVNSDGSAARIYSATVIKNSTGNYTVTLSTARSTANYTIQLSVLDSSGTGNDNYTLSYSNQTISSFDVQIGDNDNGEKNRALRDYEFMFTVIDY